MTSYPTIVLLVAFLVVGMGFVLFQRCAGSLSPTRLNLVSWNFYFEILVCTYLGTTLSLLGVSHYRVDSATSAALDLAFLASSYAIIAMPLVMLTWHLLIFRTDPRQALASYLTRPTSLATRKTGKSSELFYWQILSVLSIGAVAYTYYHLQSITFLDALTGGSAEEVGQARIAASLHFTGNEYIRNIFALLLAPLCSYVAFGYWRLTRTKVHMVWFFLSAVCALLALGYNGAKAPVVFFFVTLFLISLYLKGRASLMRLVGLGTFLAFLILGLYVVFAGHADFDLNSGPIGRIVFSQMAGFPLSLDTFPESHRFLEGGGFPAWLAGIIGERHVRSSRVLMEIYNWRAVATGTAGFMNTFYMGEAWANFGWAGLILSPVVVGIFIQTIYGTLLILPKSPPTVALMAYFVLRMPVTGGFVDFLWNVGALSAIFFVTFGAHWTSLFSPFSPRRRPKPWGHPAS